jgi:hypothetical protein
MQIILLNGPPRAGKDSLALALQRSAGWKQSAIVKFADELKHMTHRAHGYVNATADAFEHCKDDPEQGPQPGVTWRQAYIAMSERYVKPLFGDDYFGHHLAETIRDYPYEFQFVSDSGFVGEAKVLIDAFPGQVRLVHVHRTGCTFENDSRGWIELHEVPTFDVLNDGSLANLDHFAAPAILKWVEAQQ